MDVNKTFIGITMNLSSTASTSSAGASGTATTGMNTTQLIEVIEEGNCPRDEKLLYPSIIGIDLAIPQWEAILTAIILTLIILLTIVGNILVILSVFTYKPLRIVQNFFIVSLAVADLTVAILVLPLNVAYSLLGRWEFGIHVCKMWLTSDVLCCTASILNLCAIALDRYWAITDPINYAQKRTLERVLLLIAGVWILSLLISSPPLIGWNDWPEVFHSDTPCQLTSNPGYVIYSSLGSFFIPLVIMTIVYIEIYVATRRRLRERAKAAKINTMAFRSTTVCDNKNAEQATQPDQESVSSETNHNDHAADQTVQHNRSVDKRKKREKRKKGAISNSNINKNKNNEKLLKVGAREEDSITDNNPDNSSGSANTKTNDSGILLQTPTANENENNQVKSSSCCTSSNLNNNHNNKKKQSIRKTGAVYQFIEEKQKISLSKERRAARTLGIIMGVFVFCWLPFFLMYVILPFCPTCCPTEKLINFITWLGYINSALNPIIYTIFNLDYRRAFKRLLGIKQ